VYSRAARALTPPPHPPPTTARARAPTPVARIRAKERRDPGAFARFGAAAEKDCALALAVYEDEDLVARDAEHCLKGQADVRFVLGQLALAGGVGRLAEARAAFEEARALYERSGGVDAAEKAQDAVDAIEQVRDAEAREALLAERRGARAGAAEEEASVRAAFGKFDADGSGEIDAGEFARLAAELGADPPLREAEIAEATRQIGGRDAKISFKEFYAWWVAEEVEAEVDGAFGVVGAG
jgi:hypothetical protein